MDIWCETLPVRFGSIDPSDRLTLAAAFDYFQEAATNHAEVLGVGREALARTGQVWILSRISVVMDRRPVFQEQITIRTWPRGAEKLFALRDYDIRDTADTPLVRGRSGWVVVDLAKHRPLRPQAFMAGLPLNEGHDALPGGAAGIDTSDALTMAVTRQARYSDIDFNGHVNNARYVQWIQDLFDGAIFTSADRIRLDVNYLHEIKLGETVELWKTPDPLPGTCLIEGRLHGAEPALPLFRARLEIP